MTLTGPPDSGSQVTHIDENFHEIGARSVDMIVDAIHRNEFGLPAVGGIYLVDGIWREGRTVRSPA